MKQEKELKYYERIKDWDFSQYGIETESLTKWSFYETIRLLVTKDSKILDLGTGGGEKLLMYFPECAEILGTDFSKEMIATANKNIKKSGRKNITFRVMNNLQMDVPKNYYDVVTARNTVIDPVQIKECLKPGGYLIVHGVDKDDCWDLKMLFGRGQGYHDEKPVSIIDFENILKAGFKEVELIPICKREYFQDEASFKEFLKKVPIIDDFSEENGDNKEQFNEDIDEKILDQYIAKNTYDGKIKLLRRYYGITARK